MRRHAQEASPVGHVAYDGTVNVPNINGLAMDCSATQIRGRGRRLRRSLRARWRRWPLRVGGPTRCGFPHCRWALHCGGTVFGYSWSCAPFSCALRCMACGLQPRTALLVSQLSHFKSAAPAIKTCASSRSCCDCEQCVNIGHQQVIRHAYSLRGMEFWLSRTALAVHRRNSGSVRLMGLIRPEQQLAYLLLLRRQQVQAGQQC